MTSLNIKNEDAVRLVKQLANREGTSMTTAVIDAVREKLERGQKPKVNEERVQYWLKVGRELRVSADPEWLDHDPTDALYDENGLPM